MGTWSQDAYLKAHQASDPLDELGFALTLSGDGDTLAVCAALEDGNATGIGGDHANDDASGSGAVYVYVRDGMGGWSSRAYVKAPNTTSFDLFGWGLSLSGDGTTLAVGAQHEDGNATGIDGDQTNDLAGNAGAVYLY